MRAVRLAGAGLLEVVDMAEPEPGPEQVLVRVGACGICGSDLTSYKFGLFEGVPGHEIAGRVEAVGEGVTGVEAGMSVGINPRSNCGGCAQCRSGNEHRCIDSLTAKSVEPGGFAELVVAPQRVVRALPSGLQPETACLAEPLAVALHALDRAGVRTGERATVIGLGSIGLLSVAALCARGAASVAGIDPVERRRELARGLGADPVLPSGMDAKAELEPAPLVLECSGRPESLQLAIDLAAPGGRVVLAGIAVEEVTVIPVFWITREITVLGSINSTDANYDEALGLLAHNSRIGSIITRRVSLDEVPAAYQALLHPNGEGKLVVDPRLREQGGVHV